MIRISGVSKNFTLHNQGGAVIPVMAGAELAVAPGECVGLVGASGAGKSTLMRMVWGNYLAASGSIMVGGLDVARAEPREIIALRRSTLGYVSQFLRVVPRVPTLDVVAEPLLQLGVPADQARDRAAELLALVGIPDAKRRLKDYPHQFSGGMRQRVMIAIALACDPDVLIADEPTTALDVTIQAQILELLVRLQKDTGMGLVLITHSMGVVAETAERVSVQYAGQKVEEQKVADLFHDPHHPYTAALLSALPERAKGRRLPSIPGVVPGQFDRPTGCLFSPRCAFATELCRTKAPPRLLGALCHYPLKDGVPQGHPGPKEKAA